MLFKNYCNKYCEVENITNVESNFMAVVCRSGWSQIHSDF